MSVSTICSNSGWEKHCQDIFTTLHQPSQLCRILAPRTAGERKKIMETYRDMYGEDITDQLQRTLSMNQKNEVLNILKLWMMEPHERDALVVHEALQCIDKDYMAVLEIFTCRKSSRVFLIKQAYRSMFRKHLEQEINSEPSHPYQKILTALATSHKSHDMGTSHHIAKGDAKRISEASNESTGAIDEATVLEIFSKRTIPQIKLAFSTYKGIYGHNYSKVLKRRGNGEFASCLTAVVKCMQDPSKYYSKMLYASLKGNRRDQISRVVIGCMEQGMRNVEAAFHKKHDINIKDTVCKNIPCGEYRDIILTLISTDFPVS